MRIGFVSLEGIVKKWLYRGVLALTLGLGVVYKSYVPKKGLLCCAFCVVLYHEALVKWQFELFQGIRLLVSIASLYVVSQSRHLRWMVEDWQKGK